MEFGEGREGFRRARCKEDRCFTTNNRNILPITKYDAVIFQFRDLVPENLPSQRLVLPNYFAF